jgi:exosortase E/protease (VPEID-CTERM system)
LAAISANALSRDRLLTARTAAWLIIGFCEMRLTMWLLESAPGQARWGPVFFLRDFVLWLLLCVVAFAVLAWPQRREIAALWHEEQARHNWRSALAINLAAFAALALAASAFSSEIAAGPSPPWGLFWLYTVALGATVISLARLDLSIRSLCKLLLLYRTHVVSAASVGVAVLLLGMVAIEGWTALSNATLGLTKGLLELYETDVILDAEARVLGVNGFSVKILEACSGYEGVALVTVFLGLFLWVFRGQLRFPHAFLLFPVGLGAIWLLNSVRIAALISIGAHVSPEVALRGFHSQAGWIAFLAVTVGLMFLAQKSPFLSTVPTRRRSSAGASDRVILAYLAPFIALMLASIAVEASAPYDRPLYALKVIAVGATLWAFRDIYATWTWRVSPVSAAIGVVVGAIWIATAPSPASSNGLAQWLASHGSVAVAFWLALRVLGATVMVPVAEELAFRGLLHRWIISRNFEFIPIGQVSIVAFAISSLLFGLMHERWIAGTLSGAAFAIAMYRTNRLSDPIAAHMTANATICAWAIACREWSLL